MQNDIKRSSRFLPALLVSVLSLAPTLGAIHLRAEEVPYGNIDLTSLTTESAGGTPVYIYIPSIKLFTNVEGVGIDAKGNMDVPSAHTNDVGWYQYGILPGNVGTAVLDAHNTAAFKNLNQLPVGEDIYIYTSKGKWLRFVTTHTQTYLNATLSRYTLFAATNKKQLNLITCAGELLGNGEATHRLIVSAELV